VTGIPPEAREIVRAAAHREGVTVGEWLTRRILAEQAKPQETHEQEEESLSARHRSPREAEPRRARDDFAPQLRSDEGEDLYRRIDETLRQLARRLETGERLQREAQHAMSTAASEINAATRDQAQAFQHLTTRIDRVERQGDTTGLRDAVRGLHQGLSRLAEQIAKTTSESTNQIATLSVNVEALAGKVAVARDESDRLAQSLEEKLAALAERVKQNEEERIASAQEFSLRLSQTEQHFEERLKETAESVAAGGNLDETVAKLERRMTAAEGRMEESLGRHLAGIERSLGDINGRLERAEDHGDADHAVQEALSNLSSRITSAEQTTQETLSDIQSHLLDTVTRIAAIEAAAPLESPGPGARTFAVELEGVAEAELPPFTEAPFQTAESYAAPIRGESFGSFTASEAVRPLNPEQLNAALAPENYLAQVRQAARAASEPDLESFHSAHRKMRIPAASAEAPPKGGARRVLAAAAVFVVLFGAGYFGVRLQTGRTPSEDGKSVPPQASLAPADAARQDIASSNPAPSSTPPAPAPAPVTQPQNAAPVPPSQTADLGPPGAPVPARPRDTGSVLASLMAQANSGDMKAAASLGMKYADGEGTAVNESEAARWLTRAANAGEAVAAYRLGTLYERGRGVSLDAKQAMRWYGEAARRGNRRAMHNLAVGYADGAGGDKNFAEAARWFKAAAELGLTDSQFNLAVLYERGLGVKQSLSEAYKWYAIAAAAGDVESKTRVGALANQLKPAERDTAEKAAKAFKPQPINIAANEG
jgi:localization factor PodJL